MSKTDGIAAILTASYYGRWADKYGRKRVAMLAFLGEYLSLLWQVLVCGCITKNQ